MVCVKNFNTWNIIKQNIGSEVYGKGEFFRRPILILKKLSADSCIGIPTTTKRHVGTWFWKLQTNTNSIHTWLLLHQIKHISKKRLYVRETTVTLGELNSIRKALASLLGLSWSPDNIPDQWSELQTCI